MNKESTKQVEVNKIEELTHQIESLNAQILQKDKEYKELMVTIDKVKKIKGDYDSMIKKEKQILTEEFDKQRKELMKEVDEYKYKSYNVLNNNANLKKKIKSLNNTILDRDIEIKTHKQDKEKYVTELVDLKVKGKEIEKELQKQLEIQTTMKAQEEIRIAKIQNEAQSASQMLNENADLIYNYKKFVKDMNGVVKLLIKGSGSAIDHTKDKENLNTEENECYKTLLEHKAMLLKVERKIIQKRQAGFKIPVSKAHPAIKIGYSEDEHTTQDEYASAQRKRVKISE
jgi:chromosome segregation ATPase